MGLGRGYQAGKGKAQIMIDVFWLGDIEGEPDIFPIIDIEPHRILKVCVKSPPFWRAVAYIEDLKYQQVPWLWVPPKLT